MQNKSIAIPIKKRTPLFPQRLYSMLDSAELFGYDHVISWMPDGRSFKIHADSHCHLQTTTTATTNGTGDDENQQRIAGERAILEVLQQNGFNQKRYKSFLRQLQLYGFQRTFTGPRRGECKHPFLVRGQPKLLERKSVHDFQQRSSDSMCDIAEEMLMIRASKSSSSGDSFDQDFCTMSSSEPSELFLKNDAYNYWMPSSPFLTSV
eukprot:CAMPEP_0168166880 /NCGR_PEP_ID=MMETSP0139_2-20121125/2261_1 /TAXON_ID=44445 /ORGANISM="Pseudo-nitzschia australis, Strain 10249 10 AB" /LENGTH=206 /DNA_ID=CAMNT_0008084103 /DNA_START=125 /DNA_END=745 /DNA_ORIENTATION=-